MKIKSFTSWSERLGLVRPYKIAGREISDIENVFVKIEIDDGTVGLGSGSPAQNVTGESFAECKDSLAPHRFEWLIGQPIDQYKALCLKLSAKPAANAAVDIALHDAYSKTKMQPLVDVLGRHHTALPTSITIGIKNVYETLEEAEEYLRRDFSVIKVKLGDDLEQDIERLIKLREKFNDQIILRVDMNQGYNLAEFSTFLKETEKLNIEFFEQPFPVINVEDLRQLDPTIKENIALDENLMSVTDAEKLVGKCGIYNVKLMKCGGIAAARKIARIAQVNNIDLMWGCNDESRISISAALHVAFASPNTKYLDLDGSLDLARDIVEGGFIIEKGVMRTLNKPGLGVRELLS